MTTKPLRPVILVLSIVVVAALLAGSASAALTTTFGQVVKKPQSTTNDLSEVIFDVAIASVTMTTSSAVRFRDCDADGLDSTDPWYLDVDGGGAVSTNDIRLTSVDSASGCGTTFSSGTRVGSGDADSGTTKTFAAGAGCIGVKDIVDNSRNAYNPGDIIFISLDADCTDGLEVGDVFLNTVSSGGSAGSRVTTGNAGNSFAITAYGVEVYDIDNTGSYSSNDAVYMDATYNSEAGFASPGDLRFTGVLSEGFGTVVEKGDVDVLYRLVAAGGSFAPIVVRETADSAACVSSAPPSLYLNITGGGGVGVDDVRLSSSTVGGSSFTAGTRVLAGNGDVGLVATSMNANVKRSDKNDNNDVFDDDDFVWLDSNNDGDLDENEFRISRSGTSGGSAATCISSSDVDRGQSAEAALGGVYAYFDSDNSGHYNGTTSNALADLVYLDMDADQFVTVGDVRLFGSSDLSGGTFGDVVDADDVDTTYKLDLLATQTTGVFCYLDTNGDSDYDAGETAYIRLSATTSCGTGVALTATDLRISSFASSGGSSTAAGLMVGGAQDQGASVRDGASTEAFRFIDGTSSLNLGTFDENDFAYVDMDGSGKVSVGDVLLTGGGGSGTAGEVVDAGDTAVINRDLVAFTGYAIRAFDVDGDQTFSTTDLPVFDDALTAVSTRFIGVTDLILRGQGGSTSSFNPGTVGGGGGGGGGTTVTPTQPNAAFTCIGVLGRMRVDVDGRSSSDPDGTITSYAWDFGDGKTGQGAVLAHLYDDAGSYVVRLTVTDNSGRTASLQRTVKVPVEQDNCLALQTAPPDDGADDDANLLAQIQEQISELLDRVKDTDGDGFPDALEDQQGTDPDDPQSFPGADADTQPQPGFGLAALVAGLGVALVLARRRRSA